MDLHLGDCLEVLKSLEENSIDSIVTDPPYGWRFMGKAWDGADIIKVAKAKERGGTMADGKTRAPRDLPAESAGTYDNSLTANQSFQNWTNLWAKEAMRVLKPGGHMLVFCGPRTYHRMASGVEDAGFEIRDQMQWLFGSGFPKSHDVSKGIDKAAGAERKAVGAVKRSGSNSRAYQSEDKITAGHHFETASSTDAAKQWQGWGTALKPANEPIVVARKPLAKGLTVASNVTKWGTGAINIDGSRVPSGGEHKRSFQPSNNARDILGKQTAFMPTNSEGRWPANIIFDESAAEILDEQSGKTKGGGKTKVKTDTKQMFGLNGHVNVDYADTGGASRFFKVIKSEEHATRFLYQAKASKRERNAGCEGMVGKFTATMGDGIGGREHNECEPKAYNQNHHPTVKPIKLMEYLIRLVTPPNGTVLDPFMGSGSTGVAAKNLGFKFVGIEMNEEYIEIARRRIG